MPHHGSCLCKKITFLITQDIHTIYYCHCSLCRKQSGTSSNVATLIHNKNYEWLSGFELIKTYKKETGFTANFCTNCGSTLPNHVPSLALMWIPLGSLDNEITPKIRLSFHIQSKAHWSQAMKVDQEYLALPSKNDLEKIFH